MTTDGTHPASGPPPPDRPTARPRGGNPALRWATRLIILVGIVIVALVALVGTNGTVRGSVREATGGGADVPVLGSLLGDEGPEQPIPFPHPVHLAAGIT